MTPGNEELVEVLVELTSTTAGVAAILVGDGRRLERRGLEPPWPRVSRDAAIFGSYLVGWPYACVALLVHFVRSRRSLGGLGLGLLWALVLFAGAVAAPALAAAAIDRLRL